MNEMPVVLERGITGRESHFLYSGLLTQLGKQQPVLDGVVDRASCLRGACHSNSIL